MMVVRLGALVVQVVVVREAVVVIVGGEWRRERGQGGRVRGEDIVEGGGGAGDGEGVKSGGRGGGGVGVGRERRVRGTFQGRH